MLRWFGFRISPDKFQKLLLFFHFWRFNFDLTLWGNRFYFAFLCSFGELLVYSKKSEVLCPQVMNSVLIWKLSLFEWFCYALHFESYLLPQRVLLFLCKKDFGRKKWCINFNWMFLYLGFRFGLWLSSCICLNLDILFF